MSGYVKLVKPEGIVWCNGPLWPVHVEDENVRKAIQHEWENLPRPDREQGLDVADRHRSFLQRTEGLWRCACKSCLLVKKFYLLRWWHAKEASERQNGICHEIFDQLLAIRRVASDEASEREAVLKASYRVESAFQKTLNAEQWRLNLLATGTSPNHILSVRSQYEQKKWAKELDRIIREYSGEVQDAALREFFARGSSLGN